jgi:hypothetical protein
MARNDSKRATVALALILVLAPPAARAQQTVAFRLEIPAGIDRVEVTAVRLLGAGATLAELSHPITSIGGSNSVSLPLSVASLPDSVEVEYMADDGGTPGTATLYAVSGAAFAFDTPYFLAVPSPGGTIGPQAGDPATTPFFVLGAPRSPPPPRTDFGSPGCSFESVGSGALRARVQDDESGLARVDVRIASNLSVSVADFEPGTTEPVFVDATILDPGRTATLLIRAVDQEGNRTLCKRVLRRVDEQRTRLRRR